jgi:hypothetical protein
MQAVPETWAKFHHFWKSASFVFTILRLDVVFTLHIARFGNDDDFLAKEVALGNELAEYPAYCALGFTVTVVRAGVD